MVGVLAYLVRVCLSTAIVGAQGMGAELGWSVKDNGFVLSGFFWGYMLGNFPSGIFASRYGSRKILLASMILQSILTVLSPAVSRHGGLYAFFFSSRFAWLCSKPGLSCSAKFVCRMAQCR